MHKHLSLYSLFLLFLSSFSLQAMKEDDIKKSDSTNKINSQIITLLNKLSPSDLNDIKGKHRLNIDISKGNQNLIKNVEDVTSFVALCGAGLFAKCDIEHLIEGSFDKIHLWLYLLPVLAYSQIKKACSLLEGNCKIYQDIAQKCINLLEGIEELSKQINFIKHPNIEELLENSQNLSTPLEYLQNRINNAGLGSPSKTQTFFLLLSVFNKGHLKEKWQRLGDAWNYDLLLEIIFKEIVLLNNNLREQENK